MSNRQERRRRRHIVTRDGEITHVLTSTGFEVEVSGDRLTKIWERDPLADVAPTDHVWALFAMFRVDPDTVFNGQSHLDTENLITISGPGCYRCEQTYTAAIAAAPCPGEPS